jgi:hypothetical protein
VQGANSSTAGFSVCFLFGTDTSEKNMDFFRFTLFCLSTVGMTSIIVQGVIFQPFRDFISSRAEKKRQKREQIFLANGRLLRKFPAEWLNELIHCAQCTGFWCGLLCGFFLLPGPVEVSVGGYTAGSQSAMLFYCGTLFCLGTAGSFLSALGCNVIDLVFYRKMNALRLLEEQDRKLGGESSGGFADASSQEYSENSSES